MKRCSMCGETKSLDDFHRNTTRADGRQTVCKPCNIERNKRWYREHPEARLRMDHHARSRRRRAHAMVLAYLLQHPCVDCGEADPVVLEFDHLRDKTKNVSALLNSTLAKIRREIEKCEVVCANCHRRRTAARGGYFRALLLNSEEPPPMLDSGSGV